MHTFNWRLGEPGVVFTRAGWAIHAMGLAVVWEGEPHAYEDVYQAQLRLAVG